MSQFDEIVRNISSESKKCNYNPEIGTNWDCLPMEMRNECVKWMDFKTRTRLSATSKTERSLVASKKYNIDQVRLESPGEWTLEPYSETFSNYQSCERDAFLSAMFKNSVIKNFWIKEAKFNRYICTDFAQTELAKFAPFHFKRLSLFRNQDLFFFMKNCVNLEKVDFCNDYFGCYYKMLLELPSVLKVMEFRLVKGSEFYFDFLPGLVQKWIENDAEVGKSIQLREKISGSEIPGLLIPNSVQFAEKFANRIIERTDKEVRIRMNNVKKQILFRIIGSEEIVRGSKESFFHYSCKIVPIDMQKSEYAVGDGWIQAVYEKCLKRDGKLENPVEFDAEDQAVWDDKYL